jgi:hypothetical protein
MKLLRMELGHEYWLFQSNELLKLFQLLPELQLEQEEQLHQ